MANADRLESWVRDALDKNSGDLPAFPAVAAQLLPMLEDPDVEIAEVATLIQRDQVLVTRLLRAANSAFYGAAMPAADVNEAIMRLGVAETTLVTLAAVCSTLFDLEDRAQRSVFPELWNLLWLDSLVCAHGGRFLAKELACGEPQRVFMRGTFRNVGALMVLRTIARGRVSGRVTGRLDEELACVVIRKLEAEVGAQYLAESRLPDYLVETARLQRMPTLPDAPDQAELHALRLAGALSGRVGAAPFVDPEADFDEIGRRSSEHFELDAERLAYLELQFRSLLEQARELL